MNDHYSKQLLDFQPVSRGNVGKTRKTEKEPLKILRVICQRPYFTGSGINLINLIQQSKKEGIKQRIIFGNPAGEDNPLIDIIQPEHALPVTFKGSKNSVNADVPFPVAGMSDQMPYESTKFSDFDRKMLEEYLKAFADKINLVLNEFKPDIIHSHHLWLVTALCRVLAPQIPVIATCHNTALRQMVLSPQLKPFVLGPIRELDKIAVINQEQEDRVRKTYSFNERKDPTNPFFHIGQGINTDLFFPRKEKYDIQDNKGIIRLIYAGKLSNSKGVPQLITAFEQVCSELNQPCELYLAGSGKGAEKDNIIKMVEKSTANIHLLGQLNPEELSEHFRSCDLFVLPSFYDGLPKVLLESLACGCRAIMTNQSGIKETLDQSCGVSDVVEFISLPEMKSIDTPLESALPQFTQNLKEQIKAQVARIKEKRNESGYSASIITQFGKDALFKKYIKNYEEMVKGN